MRNMRAGRKLASAVGELAKNEAASPLVISRRAAALRHALNEPAAILCLQAGCYAAGVRENVDLLNEIIDQAMNRDGKACTRLIEISKALRPHLPNPRGRLPDVPSATHELFLHLQKQAYTYDPIKGDMADKATRATRTAMASPDFDPRPAVPQEETKDPMPIRLRLTPTTYRAAGAPHRHRRSAIRDPTWPIAEWRPSG